MLTYRDWLVTAAVLGAGVVYGLWLTDTAMVDATPRAVAVLVFALGIVGCTANQREMAIVYGVDRDQPRPPMAYIVATSTIGAVALVAGLTAIVTGGEVALATLVLAMVALWIMSTARHVMRGRHHLEEVEGGTPFAKAA